MRMNRISSMFALMIVGVAPALADPLTIDLPGAAAEVRDDVAYSCTGDHKVSVDYVNAGGNSLAIVDLGDRTVLMVTVISGSGARYAGQEYVWWTKGETADFYDLTKGENAPPEFSCQAE